MAGNVKQKWIDACGDPETWVGNCYAIACTAVRAELVRGTAVYGHWLGPVAKGTFFYDRSQEIPFIPHGWIRNDMVIVDPTRWAFLGTEPEIWYGPLDSFEYDEGGNQWRKMMERPFPAFNPTDSVVLLHNLPKPVWDIIGRTSGLITIEQVCWLGNLSLTTLGEFAKPVYTSLAKAHLKAIVPIDNWRKVMGESS